MSTGFSNKCTTNKQGAKKLLCSRDWKCVLKISWGWLQAVFLTAFSPRPLPHCFPFRSQFSFRAAESLTLWATNVTTHQKTASSAGFYILSLRASLACTSLRIIAPLGFFKLLVLYIHCSNTWNNFTLSEWSAWKTAFNPCEIGRNLSNLSFSTSVIWIPLKTSLSLACWAC